mgnify:CR=1 FL=1
MQLEAIISATGFQSRQIRLFGDPVLRSASDPIAVKPGDAKLLALAEDLVDSVKLPGRAGVAAPQIGVGLRAFSYNVDGEVGYVFNPVLEVSGEPEDVDEGCLSVPGESFPTGRASWARVTGLDADGSPITLEGEDLFARMLQHETGHLDGFLYVDRLIGRNARSAKRAIKSHGWGVPGLSWMPGEDPDPFGH